MIRNKHFHIKMFQWMVMYSFKLRYLIMSYEDTEILHNNLKIWEFIKKVK